jgi:hypothetical protein
MASGVNPEIPGHKGVLTSQAEWLIEYDGAGVTEEDFLDCQFPPEMLQC